ncbi:hypothetical protein Pcinc_021826 [Petrolisthes cinctipes]|uniref:Uncharacterized protein n=1 Tax=Petrolisthes cinctipes TaxID=88211 RepID=A0AAE1FGL0_PETCI|nr:hypothetical protein Pcinc_021826 [Petrolisthes cinctipes]
MRGGSCKVKRLTDKVGESSSPSFPLSSVYPLALRSLPQPWQDFSFAFEDSGGFPVGSLKVSTFAGKTELSLAALLNTFDTTGQEQQLQRIQLSEEESGQASIRNWTFISFEVLSDKLSISLRGLEELVFGEVNASEFQRGVARVANGHSLDVALGCTSTQLPQGNETSLYTTTPDPDDGDDDDDNSRSGTPVVVVILVLLGLILLVGVWYWRGRRRSRRASSEGDQGEEMEGRTGRSENGNNSGGGGGGGREGAGRPEERPLVEGSSAGGVVVGTQSETNTGGHRTPEGHTDDVRGAQNRNDTQRSNTEDSDGEEAMQGTYYATQSEIKKSTQSIYEPE